uniref:Putative secreted peptide n=1 Tax=Anopheles braziliensis TaxID=58242 RepID=A0A2M3ZQV1_9DIPT
MCQGLSIACAAISLAGHVPPLIRSLSQRAATPIHFHTVFFSLARLHSFSFLFFFGAFPWRVRALHNLTFHFPQSRTT